MSDRRKSRDAGRNLVRPEITELAEAWADVDRKREMLIAWRARGPAVRQEILEAEQRVIELTKRVERLGAPALDVAKAIANALEVDLPIDALLNLRRRVYRVKARAVSTRERPDK
ncbi:MAG: hypothetical protein DRJ42_25660 [Deltaproteobacteria bacterium]|nr:MAG: hypothetical protein DRJ42_25660 [Deltaproteobacteria bacterium]